MAMVKCQECGNDVSDKAAACPKCGAPVSKQKTPVVKKPQKPPTVKEAFWTMLVIAVLGWIFWPSLHKDAPAAQAQAKEESCKPDDLQCLGDKGTIGASVYCQKGVEKLALHRIKWTDGTFETKFSRFRWHDKAKGQITYVGDKVEFQNGYGAFTPMIYECDMESDNKTVIDVRADEGRLP